MHMAVIGAGPIGLEAALAARQHGHQVTVYERAATVAGHVRLWGHVGMFTPWDMNVTPRMAAALGDHAPHGSALPTGTQFVTAVLEPLAQTPALARTIRVDTNVLAVGREGLLKHEAIGSPERAGRRFRLLLQDQHGVEEVAYADAVIDATGTYGNPNRLGDGGIDAPGERVLENRITRTLEPIEHLAGRAVLVTGAGHSAQTAAVALAELARHAPDTRVVWALRRREPTFRLPHDPLSARDTLHAEAEKLLRGANRAVDVRRGVVTDALTMGESGQVRVILRNGEAQHVDVDHILALNGSAPDSSLYRQLQIHECYASLAPMNLAAQLLAQGDSAGDCLATALTGPEAPLESRARLLHPRREVLRAKLAVPVAHGLGAGQRRL